jgi:hypothetical protein
MFPQCPSSKDYERIMTLLGDAHPTAPPLIKGYRLRRASSLEDNEPELWGKHTRDEEVLNYFASSKRRQHSGCGRPRCPRWSPVEHRLFATNQMKK